MLTETRDSYTPTGYKVMQIATLAQVGVGSWPVCQYRDDKLGRLLAGKTISPPLEVENDEDRDVWLANTLREGRVQWTLENHDHVVRVEAVLDVLDADARPTGEVEIITPWIEGGSAFDRLQKDGPFDAAAAVEIMRGVSLALADLHGKGFLHRDVKTPNIFVTPGPNGPRGLLSDFGLVIEQGPDGSAVGHPQPTPWIGPEQMDPDPTAMVASDLFGVAASLIDLLRPFVTADRPNDRAAVADRMTHGRLPLPKALYRPPPSLPRPVRTLLNGLLRPAPDQRTPADARTVADRLNVSVPPWRLAESTESGFRYIAPGAVPVAVTGEFMPRAKQWRVRATRHIRGNDRRILEGRLDLVRDQDLEPFFDAARTVWSR